MGPEHAAIHVRLVDYDERQVGQHVGPRVVVGQDPDVEHVGVGDDEVASLADRGPLRPRSVAVVDRGTDGLRQAERVQRTGLVLSQRLGRVQVESAGGAIGAQDVERGQLEAQRLPGRGARGDDRRPFERRLERLRLMGVEMRDPRPLERGATVGLRSSGSETSGPSVRRRNPDARAAHRSRPPRAGPPRAQCLA